MEPPNYEQINKDPLEIAKLPQIWCRTPLRCFPKGYGSHTLHIHYSWVLLFHPKGDK